jgi:hypothetical protein
VGRGVPPPQSKKNSVHYISIDYDWFFFIKP